MFFVGIVCKSSEPSGRVTIRENGKEKGQSGWPRNGAHLQKIEGKKQKQKNKLY